MAASASAYPSRLRASSSDARSERAGLDPRKAPERFAELREGYRLLERLQKSVRRPRDRAAAKAG